MARAELRSTCIFLNWRYCGPYVTPIGHAHTRKQKKVDQKWENLFLWINKLCFHKFIFISYHWWGEYSITEWRGISIFSHSAQGRNWLFFQQVNYHVNDLLYTLLTLFSALTLLGKGDIIFSCFLCEQLLFYISRTRHLDAASATVILFPRKQITNYNQKFGGH